MRSYTLSSSLLVEFSVHGIQVPRWAFYTLKPCESSHGVIFDLKPRFGALKGILKFPNTFSQKNLACKNLERFWLLWVGLLTESIFSFKLRKRIQNLNQSQRNILNMFLLY